MEKIKCKLKKAEQKRMAKYQQDDVEEVGRERKDSAKGAAGEKGKKFEQEDEKQKQEEEEE